MAASGGISGFGTTVLIATASTGAYSAFGEIVSVSGPNISVEDIDLTHMESPNTAREHSPGLLEGGDVQLTINYVKSQATAIYALVQTSKWYQIKFADTANWVCQGYANGHSQEIPNNDKIQTTLGVKFTGKPVFATT